MNRHEAREKLTFSVYQHLLLNESLTAIVNKNFDEEVIDPYIKNLESLILINEKEYIERIDKHLNKWTFNRLGYVDQAILLVALAEFEDGSNDKAVVLDEAIKLAKKYCDEDSYKYINGVLDKIC